MVDYKNISIFQGLNSLRFFAAFLVVMHHSETIRMKYGLANLQWLSLFRNGSNAVTFFFVLSGFLITYLLLKEQKQTGTVSVKNFYWKRVLRIWPLYFLLFFSGTLLLPFVFSRLNVPYEMPYTFHQVWAYFVFFLPGLVTFYYGHHLLEPLWSIGVEEVFYLVWAPVFKFGKKRILPILIAVIAIKIGLKLACLYVIQSPLIGYLVDMFQFEAMAVGGLGAYFIYYRGEMLHKLWVYKRPAQLVIYPVLLIYLVFNANIHNGLWKVFFSTPIVSYVLVCLLFLYLIVGVSLIRHNIFRINNQRLSYLGEISYGIYMYHLPIIFGVVLFLGKFLEKQSLLAGSLVYYAVVSAVVILTSSVSKKYMENYFLRLKRKLV